MIKSFRKWLLQEKTDIFGFEKENAYDFAKPRDENPLKIFGIDALMSYLEMQSVGTWPASRRFVNEIHWGTGNGSMRIWLGTGLNVMIERQGIDLEGTPRWFTKKVFQIDQSGFGGYEEVVANDLLKELNRVYQSELDSPMREWNGLEKLVTSMASKIRRVARPIFIFEGIRKVDDNTFIIQLGLRGHGIEAPDQQRVEQNQTSVYYSRESGIIRMTNYNIESPIGAHTWELLPADTDWYFAPTQGQDEIIETIANTMHWY
jgi:hypothetical protein